MSAEVAVLQAGAWGTTLATILARDGGRGVVLWTRDPEQAEDLAQRRENRRYLAGIRIPDSVRITSDLAEAAAVDDLIVCVPTQGVAGLRDRLAPLLRHGHHVLSATKGLDPASSRRMSELWAEAVPAARVAVLSGPNLSREIASGSRPRRSSRRATARPRGGSRRSSAPARSARTRTTTSWASSCAGR